MLSGGQVVVTDLQRIQQAAVAARQEIADQVAGSARVQATASQAAAELERRRIQLVLAGIEDTKERRIAAVNLTTALESQAVQKLVTERVRLGEITEAQARDTIEEFDRLGEAARRSQIGRLDGQIQGVAGSSKSASQALVSLSQGIEDASFAQGNFAQIVRFSGNNVSQFVTQLGYARAEAASTGRTVSSLLVSSLAGPAGLVVATSLLTAGLPILIDKLSASEEGFRGSAEAAREARDAYRGAYEAQIALITAQDASSKRQQEESAARFRALQNRVGATTARRREIEEEIRLLRERTRVITDQGAVDQSTEADRQQLRALYEQLRSVNTEFERYAEYRDSEAERLEGLGIDLQVQEDLGAIGLDAEQIADAAADAGRNAGRALGSGTAEGVRQTAGEVADARAAVLAAALAVEADLRVESIESSREREIAAVGRTLSQRIAVARAAYGVGSTLEVAAVESAGRQVVEINRRSASEAQAEARELAEARIDLQLRYAALAGASEEELLERRVAAMREAGLVTEEVELDLLELRQRVAEEGLQAALDALEDQMEAEDRARREREREEDRAAAEHLRRVEGYVDGVLAALRRSFDVRRRFSDEDVAAERADFAAREAELEESLRRRQISQREYDAEVRALAADRAAFEREAAEDSASAAVRALGAVVEFAREAALDFIQAELAKAVASAIASAFASIPFPFNIAAAGVAAAAAVAASSMVPAFASGGPVRGPGGPTEDAVLARLSDGEHVLTAAEVAGLGGHSQVERLRALARVGDVPRFAFGGAVVGRAPMPRRVLDAPPASALRPGTALDLTGLEARLGQLVDQVVRLKTAPPPVAIGDAASRQLRDAGAQASARTSIRSITPRRR